jgi:hypothetical protein
VDAHPDARVDDLVQRVVEAIESALRRRRQRKLAGHRERHVAVLEETLERAHGRAAIGRVA